MSTTATQKPTPALGVPFQPHHPIPRTNAAQWLKMHRHQLVKLGSGYYMTKGGKLGLSTRTH